MVIIGILPVVVAYAISPPSSTPTVSDMHYNRNLLETGDILLYGEYDLPYDPVPTTASAAQSFIFQLIDTDNATELGAITPFVFFDNGYNEGVFGMYFAPADNFTWGLSYILRISQNPAQFASPTSEDYLIAPTAFTTKTSQLDNQVELAINVINLANELEQIYTTYTLLDTAAGGTVLSSPSGETYFRGVIYGLQLMAPSLFMVQVLEYDTSYRTWTTTNTDNYSARFDATWVGASENATMAMFDMTQGSVMAIIFILPLMIGSIVVTTMKFRKAEPGFIMCAVLAMLGLLMGWLPAAIFATIYQLLGMYIAYIWFYARG